MYWDKKGYEFDMYRDSFQKKNILIYGAGFVGEQVYKSCNYLWNFITGWIDKKGGEKACLPVYRFEDLSSQILNDNIIIVAVNEPIASLFVRQLINLGLKENIDFFRWITWNDRFKYIYAYYKNNFLAVSFCGLQISNVCNLNCKGCLSFTSYIKHPRIYGFEYVKDNLSHLFGQIDYVDNLELCGGEPLLIPEVEKIYEYTGKHYGDRITLISTVTNATCMPSDELCSVWKKYGIRVYLDDYRDSVPQVRDSFEKIFQKMKMQGVDVEIRKVDTWIDLGITENLAKSDEKTLLKSIECSNNRLSMLNNRLFYCDYECFADMAGVYNAVESDYIPLNNSHMNISKMDILEFTLGYNKEGFCSMCRFCNGDGKISTHHINVAEQLKRE